jgi:tRNA dimethylallyltransferase
VYKGFDIGTAKPTIEEQAGIPHYMIDIVEPEFDYSAGLYKQHASEIIEKIHLKGKTPIIVGGTGLYIDILLKNYELPKVEPDKSLRGELKLLSKDDLYDRLKNLDVEASEKIDKNDTKKIIRAIEVIKATGKSLSDNQGINETQYDVEWIGRNYERDVLYSRIDKRVDVMLAQGLLDETKSLLDKHGAIPNLVNTIGYREIYGYLTNKYSLDFAVDLLKKNTRNYAKRQLTWFRKNPEIKWNIFPEKLKK